MLAHRWGAARAEEESCDDDAGRVCVEVVAVHVGTLQVSSDEVAVEVDRSQVARTERSIAPGFARAERMEEPGEGEDPECCLHRTRPVDALPVRVRVDPVLERFTRCLGMALVAVEKVRLTGCGVATASARSPRELSRRSGGRAARTRCPATTPAAISYPFSRRRASRRACRV